MHRDHGALDDVSRRSLHRRVDCAALCVLTPLRVAGIDFGEVQAPPEDGFDEPLLARDRTDIVHVLLDARVAVEIQVDVFLRFAAALAVVVYHAGKHVAATGADPGWLFRAGEAVGFAGVDVFFVISGFIMFHTTRESAGAAAAAEFLKRRVARIYSGYWPFFLFAALVFSRARPEHFAESNLLTSFLLWPMPLNQVLLDVSWTLSYEMYFYLLFTVLVLLIALGLGAGRLAPSLQRKFNFVAAILVIIVGLEFLFRAGKLFGWIAEIRWGFWPVW